MDHIKRTLDAFSAHLGLKHEDTTLSELAHKYLALGTNIVETRWVYDAVASDYALLSLKTYNPPLQEYAHPRAAPLDVATFVALIEAGYSDKSKRDNLKEFERFVDEVVQRKSAHKGERWVDACRADKWRDVATFLALNYMEHPKLDALLKATWSNNDVSELRKRMRSFKCADKRQLAREMASLISSLELNDAFVDAYESVNATDSKPTEKQADIVYEAVSKTIQWEPTHPLDVKETIETFKPHTEAYRKRACVGATVDCKRIAQQMICASLPLENADFVLLRSQQKLTPLVESERSVVADMVKTSNVVNDDTLKDALLHSVIAQNVSQACNRWTWAPRTLLAYMVDPKGHMDARSYARYQRLNVESVQDGSIRKLVE